jgi:hypothetical protein
MAGRGGIGGPDNRIQQCRIRKTRRLFEDREGFMADLSADLTALLRKANRAGKRAAARLNGTSDIGWSRIPCPRDGQLWPNVFHAFPEIQFYDYTKVPARFKVTQPDNYAVTFSLSDSNDAHAAQALAAGLNVAVVLRVADSAPMPETWSGYPVVDGTEHDFRFLDPMGGHIIGLRPKGPAKKDTSGFVRDLDTAMDPARPVVLAVNAA